MIFKNVLIHSPQGLLPVSALSVLLTLFRLFPGVTYAPVENRVYFYLPKNSSTHL
jgi:hypothetical protein